LTQQKLQGTAKPPKKKKTRKVTNLEAHRRAQDVAKGIDFARKEIGAFSFWRFWLRGFIFGTVITAGAAVLIVYLAG